MKLLSKEKIFVVFILLIAFFLRFINIETNPPSLYGDELTLAYDAYSILKTGHDQTGAFLPLTFAMSEGRPPVYVYLSMPLVALLGPTALAVRFLSVLSGVGIALLVYLLLRQLVSRRAALVGIFLAAISPWDLSLSRGGFETHLALFLSLLGIYTFLQAKTKPGLLLISAVSFGLSLFTYHSYKLVVPLFLPFLFWFTGGKILVRSKSFLVAASMFAVFLGVWLLQIVGGSEVRFKNTSILSQGDLSAVITEKVNTERTLDSFPLKSLLHNKPFEYLATLGDNYFSHFSTDFLFLHGDGNPRHNQGLMGGMYVVEFLLVLLGINFLWQKQKKLLLLLTAWILVAPVATILVSPAHALRSTFLLPPLIMLSAAGLNYLWEIAKGERLAKLILVMVLGGLVGQFIVLADRVYFLYPKQFGHFWSVSAKYTSQEAISVSQKYDYVVISDTIDSINLAFPVYAKLNPVEVISQYGKDVKKYGNIYIGNVTDLPGQIKYYK